MANSPHLEKIRHSTAHVLAMAVLRLYPDTRLGIGVATEDGFFHDFEFSNPIQQEDLEKIENEMLSIVREKLPFNQLFLPREIAITTMLQRGQMYKAELLQDSADEEISFFRTGSEFIDPCRGPHVSNTEELLAFKLTSLSGAYWKGDENRPQLQRIFGVAFRSMEELTDFFAREEKLKNIDFRKLAKNLEYMLIDTEQVSLTNHGQYIYNQLSRYIQGQIEKSNFHQIGIPVYVESCQPQLEQIFEMRNHSYRELPVKWYNIGLRMPKEGIVINEKILPLVRQLNLFTLAREVDFDMEIREQINVLVNVFQQLKFDLSIKVFSPDTENDFVRTISSHLETRFISHTVVINRRSNNVYMFIQAKDHMNREWKLAHLQIVYPAKTFYTARDGDLAPTLNIISEVIFEQLIAYLLEDKQGELPLWLAPRKCTVVPISEKYNDYAEQVNEIVEGFGLNPHLDNRAEKMQAKIRDAELKKVPLILIVGEKEQQNQAVSVRLRGSNEVGMVALTELKNIIDNIE